MTRSQSVAYRLRWLILVVGMLYVLFALLWMAGPLMQNAQVWHYLRYPVNVLFGRPLSSEIRDVMGLMGTPLTQGKLVETTEFIYAVNGALVLGILLIAQWAFLRPSRGWTIKLTSTGRPLRSAVFAAALMAALLSVGFIALLLELPGWWEPIMGGGRSTYIWEWGGSPWLKSIFENGWGVVGIWVMLALLWTFWAFLFFQYWLQGDRYTWMGRIVRGLVAGSILEAFIAVPVHVWAARQRECYCCRGTYTTLVFSGAVLMWAFGPGIILLFMREKYRRAKLLGSGTNECPKCGYDLRGSLAAGRTACPECGAEAKISPPGIRPSPEVEDLSSGAK